MSHLLARIPGYIMAELALVSFIKEKVCFSFTGEEAPGFAKPLILSSNNYGQDGEKASGIVCLCEGLQVPASMLGDRQMRSRFPVQGFSRAHRSEKLPEAVDNISRLQSHLASQPMRWKCPEVPCVL